MNNGKQSDEKKVYVRRYPTRSLPSIPEEDETGFARVGPVLAVSTMDEKDKKEGFTRVGPVRTVNEK